VFLFFGGQVFECADCRGVTQTPGILFKETLSFKLPL
jgi:hypothetical protein